jgi:hypothetical protein
LIHIFLFRTAKIPKSKVSFKDLIETPEIKIRRSFNYKEPLNPQGSQVGLEVHKLNIKINLYPYRKLK